MHICQNIYSFSLSLSLDSLRYMEKVMFDENWNELDEHKYVNNIKNGVLCLQDSYKHVLLLMCDVYIFVNVLQHQMATATTIQISKVPWNSVSPLTINTNMLHLKRAPSTISSGKSLQTHEKPCGWSFFCWFICSCQDRT